MSTRAGQDEGLLDQILEDERGAAIQEFRERQEVALNTAELWCVPGLRASGPQGGNAHFFALRHLMNECQGTLEALPMFFQ